MSSSSCIVCLSGLPASGKSSLATKLIVELNRLWPSCIVLNVTYDVLIPDHGKDLLASLNNELQSNSDSLWKTRRQLIVKAVNCLISDFTNKDLKTERSNCKPQPEDAKVQKMERRILKMNNVDIRQIKSKDKTLFIIIDDNLYYASMRHEFYQVARTHMCGFCQIFLKCDTKIALERNRLRKRPVPDDVISRMAEKMEYPFPLKNSWEKNSRIIYSLTECTNTDMTRILFTIIQAYEKPIVPKTDIQLEEEERARSKYFCQTNVLHQIDSCLKKLVGRIMQKRRQEITKSGKDWNPTIEFGTVNSARLAVIDSYKKGLIVLPKGIIECIESCAVESVSTNLEEILAENMKSLSTLL